jgi:hypothetical protein
MGGFIASHAMGLVGGAFAAHKVYESGAHLAHEEIRQSASGMSANEMMEAAAESARISAKFPAISPTQVNHMLRNARAIVGSYAEAAEIVEPLAKLRVVAQGARPGADVTEDFDQLVKGLEIKGVTQDPKKFRDYLQGIAKGLNVFGDTLKPYQYYEMFKYGRQATPGLSSNFILGTAPTLAQELGGSSYGNAVSGFNRSIVGGRMEHSALKEMYRLGLVGKGDLDFLKTGEVKGLKAGHAIKGWEVAQEDPNRWVKEFFLPALLKAGITTTQDVQKEVSTVFSNKVAAQMVSILATQQSRIEKDLALLRGAPGLEAADKYRNDPMIATMALKNSVEGLTATLSVSTIRGLAPVMTSVAEAIGRYTARLTEMNSWREGHPNDPSLGQKRINRLLNAAGGVDSDLSRGEISQTQRNDAAWARLKARADAEQATAKGKRAQVPGFDFSLMDRYLDDKAAGNTGARGELGRALAAHNARLAAQDNLVRFQRDLPRDMRMQGRGSSEIAGSGAFGLGVGGGAYGNYDPATGMPRIPKVEDQTAKVNLDTAEAEGKIASLMAQINALRGGVQVPIEMVVKGNVPSLGAVQRGNFSVGLPQSGG